MYRHINCEQGSDEWFSARLGKWSGSAYSKAITAKSMKRSASADEINNRLVAEVIMNKPDETFQSEAMRRGKELEEEAFLAISFVERMRFETCGFLVATDEEGRDKGYGCSPDGINEEELIGLELKCPSPHTHVAYMNNKKGMPSKYYAQVQGCLMVTGFLKWIFASYCPGFPPYIIEVERDEEFIRCLRKIVEEESLTVAESIEQIRMEVA